MPKPQRKITAVQRKDWRTLPTEHWNTLTFTEYFRERNRELYGVEYVPLRNWRFEQSLIRKALDAHGSEILRAAFDECFCTYRPTREYPILTAGFDARVTEYERFPFSANKARIVLANFRELTAADAIFQATVASRRAIVYTTENAVLKGVKYDDSITLVDGLGMAVSDDANRLRVRLGQVGPGDYGLAAYNKAGAKTLWFDAATGDGRFAGTLVAAGGQFSGEITGGTITIGSGNNVFKAGTAGISLGHATFGSAPFRVTAAGALTATNANISGTIHAAAGTIGGWTINAGSLTGPGSIIGGSITGSTVQTKAAGNYPRIGLSSTDNLLTAETDAGRFIQIHSRLNNNPALVFRSNVGGVGEMHLLQSGNVFNVTGVGSMWFNTSSGRIDINAPAGIYANGVRLDVVA